MLRSRIIRFILMWYLCAGFVPALASASVVDDLGREVTLDQPPERVVSMIPTHTETVCAIGGCDLLVAVDMFSNYPARVTSLPSLGSAFDPDVEALIALEPDLVLTDEYSGLHEALSPLRIPVYVGTPQTIEDISTITRDVGVLLGLEANAERVIEDIERRVEALVQSVEDAERPTVFIELDPSPYSAGPGSYLGSLLTLAGGQNIVPARLGDFPLVDPELIVASDPDVLLMLDGPYGESIEMLQARPGWRALSAVADGAVVLFTSEQVDMLNRAGPRLPDALALLIEVLEEYRR